MLAITLLGRSAPPDSGLLQEEGKRTERPETSLPVGIDDTTFARTRGKLQKDVKGILWEKEMKAKHIVEGKF